MITNLLLEIQWQENTLYDAGTRKISLPWTCNVIPQTGHQILFYPENFPHYHPHESFSYEDKQYTIYEWINQHDGWRIKDMKWSFKFGKPQVTLFITDDVSVG